MQGLSDQKLQRNWVAFVQNVSSSGGSTSIVALAAAEQSELRRIAGGLGETEMAERMRGQQPPARGALQIAALNEERLDDVLEGIARPRQRPRYALHADRATAVIHRNGCKITPIHGVEA